MFQSNKIPDNVLHLNFAPNYTSDVENTNNIENTSYTFQFFGNSTKDLKGEHLLAYNNNYVSESFSISEWNLYGSSRLGMRSADRETDVVILAARNYNWINSTVTNEYIAPTQSFTYKKYRLLGAKTFELTNHLGNVITTISDRKLMVEDQQNLGFVHHYKPEILSIGEQYAFGMSMPGRTFSVEDYRYGYNGKAEDNDISGEENTYDFGDRLYNARIGRWFSVDDLYFDYVPISTYAFALNSPITLKDADGNEVVDANGNKVEISITKAKNGEYIASYDFFEGTDDVTKDQFYANAARVIDAMMDVPRSRRIVKRANRTSRKVHVELVTEILIDDSEGFNDAPFGLTTSWTDIDNYSLGEEFKKKKIWSVQVLEKNIQITREEIIENNKQAGDKIKFGKEQIVLTEKRFKSAFSFNISNLRGIIGGHEIKHFLTKNRGDERKANRTHRAIERQKTRKQNEGSKPNTRYKNPRFL
jgi:RHS repeat-associated protein